MQKTVVALATLALLLTALATPASAQHASIDVYSPVANKSWWYSQLDHKGYLGLTAARDVTHGPTWTGDEDVRFTTTGLSVEGYVEAADVNCATGGPDNYVILQIWLGGEFYGKISYVHLRTLAQGVSPGQWISSGKILGKIQNQASWNGATLCWENVHVHMEQQGGSWTPPHQTYGAARPYSTPVLTYSNGVPQFGSRQQAALRLTDKQIGQRGPVVR